MLCKGATGAWRFWSRFSLSQWVRALRDRSSSPTRPTHSGVHHRPPELPDDAGPIRCSSPTARAPRRGRPTRIFARYTAPSSLEARLLTCLRAIRCSGGTSARRVHRLIIARSSSPTTPAQSRPLITNIDLAARGDHHLPVAGRHSHERRSPPWGGMSTLRLEAITASQWHVDLASGGDRRLPMACRPCVWRRSPPPKGIST